MIQVGSTLPEVDFGLLVDGEMTNPGTNELFSDKRVEARLGRDCFCSTR